MADIERTVAITADLLADVVGTEPGGKFPLDPPVKMKAGETWLIGVHDGKAIAERLSGDGPVAEPRTG